MKKILVVDDEREVGDILRDFFNDSGYETLVALDATSGLRLVKEQKPDLVLLDVVMPKIDGLECLRQIKKTNPDTIVIVVSGLADEQIAKEAIEAGAYDYIVKPFNFSHLRDYLLPRLFPS